MSKFLKLSEFHSIEVYYYEISWFSIFLCHDETFKIKNTPLHYRLDMAALADPKLLPVTRHPVRKSAPSQDESTQLLIHQASATSKLRQLSGMEVLDEQVLKMRWGCDLRVEEVKRCLISSQPAKITLQQKPETSDHHFIELKQRHLLAICQRTMALPVGRLAELPVLGFCSMCVQFLTLD